MPVLCTADFARTRFLDLIENTLWAGDELLVAFSPVESFFGAFSIGRSILKTTEQGRIFSPSGELRWRDVDGSIRTVYLGERAISDAFADRSYALAGLKPALRHILLWGVRTDGKDEWLEQQVPVKLFYPIPAPAIPRGRVELAVEDWSGLDGIPKFSRYHSVRETGGGY